MMDLYCVYKVCAVMDRYGARWQHVNKDRESGVRQKLNAGFVLHIPDLP